MAKTTSLDPLAELAATRDAALGPAKAGREQHAAAAAEFVAAPAAKVAVTKELVAAKAAGDTARETAARAKLARVEETIRLGPDVVKELDARARVLDSIWSTAWTEWRNALESEMLGDLPAKRAAFEAKEAATRAEYERLLGEAPTL